MKAEEFLIENEYNWITVLVHENAVEIFADVVGLDENRDLGENNPEWLNEDFVYIEMTGKELLELLPVANFVLINKEEKKDD